MAATAIATKKRYNYNHYNLPRNIFYGTKNNTNDVLNEKYIEIMANAIINEPKYSDITNEKPLLITTLRNAFRFMNMNDLHKVILHVHEKSHTGAEFADNLYIATNPPKFGGRRRKTRKCLRRR